MSKYAIDALGRRHKITRVDFDKYFVRFTDHKGQHVEEYLLASDAMFRFQSLCNYPGIYDISWTTQRGYVFASANLRQGSLI